MIFGEQKLIVFQDLFCFFASPFFCPVCHPPGINLASQKEPFLLECTDTFFLISAIKIIDPNIGTFPMAFMNIIDPINIILSQVDIQICPQLPNLLHIRFISPVKSILILNLKHYDTPIFISLSPHMGSHHMHQTCKVDFCLSQENWIVGPQLYAWSIQKTCRHSSKIPLSTHIGPRPEQNHHLMLFSEFQEQGQVLIASFKIELTFGQFVIVPQNINTEGIQTQCLDHQYSMLPILHWYPRIVHFSRPDWQQLACVNAQLTLHIDIK